MEPGTSDGAGLLEFFRSPRRSAYSESGSLSVAYMTALKNANVRKCSNSSKCGFVNLQSIKSR